MLEGKIIERCLLLSQSNFETGIRIETSTNWFDEVSRVKFWNIWNRQWKIFNGVVKHLIIYIIIYTCGRETIFKEVDSYFFFDMETILSNIGFLNPKWTAIMVTYSKPWTIIYRRNFQVNNIVSTRNLEKKYCKLVKLRLDYRLNREMFTCSKTHNHYD